jgi:hypothetical protein
MRRGEYQARLQARREEEQAGGIYGNDLTHRIAAREEHEAGLSLGPK